MIHVKCGTACLDSRVNSVASCTLVGGRGTSPKDRNEDNLVVIVVVKNHRHNRRHHHHHNFEWT